MTSAEARAILCPSWCTEPDAHLEVDDLDSGVRHHRDVVDLEELPPTATRAAGSSVTVSVAQYVGRDDAVSEPTVFLRNLASRDYGDAVELTPEEAVRIAQALLTGATLARTG